MQIQRFLGRMGVKRPYLPRVILLLIGGLLAALLAFVDIVGAQELEPRPTQTPRVIIITATPGDVIPAQVIDPVRLKALQSGEDIRAEIDTLVDSLWPTLQKQQDAYRSMTGRYFQGLPTHMGQRPVGGVGQFPSGWYARPTDQQYRWSDIGVIRFAPMSFDLRVDVYDGPEGAGWMACYQVEIDKIPWEKCRNYGPEALRSTEWAIVAQEATP